MKKVILVFFFSLVSIGQVNAVTCKVDLYGINRCTSGSSITIPSTNYSNNTGCKIDQYGINRCNSNSANSFNNTSTTSTNKKLKWQDSDFWNEEVEPGKSRLFKLGELLEYFGKTPKQRSQSTFKLKNSNQSNNYYQGNYCEIDWGYTDSGEGIFGYFYMISDRYGDADNVYTDSGETIYGTCYRSSGRYCEIDDAYTESGEAVYGECTIQ